MRITVRQLKQLIKETIAKTTSVRRIHEQASDVEAKKAELVAKWKNSGRRNGMFDSEWALQMYLTGEAMATGNESKLQGEGIDIKFMKERYPGFTSEDFKQVAKEVDQEVETAAAEY